jgi:hypothetical protein
MPKEIAVPVPLKVWQDPQGDVVLHSSRGECNIYFGCWESAGEPADYICKLIFNHAWAVRGGSSEYLPYEHKEHHRTCIYEIVDSEWLRQKSERRSKSYPDWKKWDGKVYRHYLVGGHDNDYEIIAASFEEQVISRSEAGELARLCDEA